jgi:hypothetical protein
MVAEAGVGAEEAKVSVAARVAVMLPVKTDKMPNAMPAVRLMGRPKKDLSEWVYINKADL